MLSLYSAVVFMCLLQGICSQVILKGQCPSSVTLFNGPTNGVFPANGYVYHYEGIPDSLTADLKCVASQFTVSNPNNFVTYAGVLTQNNQQVTRRYTAFITGTNSYRINTGKELVSYFAIDSDNKTYVTYYSCENISITQYRQYIWVLTNQRKPSTATISAARAGIVAKKLNFSLVKLRDQTSCPAV